MKLKKKKKKKKKNFFFFFFFFFFFLGRLHFSLGSFLGKILAPRATILPQSPSSLFPAWKIYGKEMTLTFNTHITS